MLFTFHSVSDRVRMHCAGLFDSLTNVTFDKVDKSKMTEMFSQQGEKVEFERAVEARGNIEVRRTPRT